MTEETFESLTAMLLKNVIQWNKNLLKMSEVKFVNVPAFDEIGVKHLYDQVIAKEGMA